MPAGVTGSMAHPDLFSSLCESPDHHTDPSEWSRKAPSESQIQLHRRRFATRKNHPGEDEPGLMELCYYAKAAAPEMWSK